MYTYTYNQILKTNAYMYVYMCTYTYVHRSLPLYLEGACHIDRQALFALSSSCLALDTKVIVCCVRRQPFSPVRHRRHCLPCYSANT